MKHTLLIVACILLVAAGQSSPSKKKIMKAFGFVYVPTAVVDLEEFDSQTKSASISGFYMHSTEITNKQYRTFLEDLIEQGKKAEYNKHFPDTNNWNKLYAKSDLNPMATYYFTHEEYDNFPVVNVSHESAQAYCEWLEGKVNSTRSAYHFDVRLPSREEWILAAKKSPDSKDQYPYGPFMRNSKGCYLMNFKAVRNDNVTYDSSEQRIVVKNNQSVYMDDGAFFTAEAKSYFPNIYGLYNMCGNVAEFVHEGAAVGGGWNSFGYDVRISSKIPTTKSSCEIGFRPVISAHPIKDDVQ